MPPTRDAGSPNVALTTLLGRFAGGKYPDEGPGR